MKPPAQRWVWRGRPLSAHDGDTVTCVLDLGVGLTITIPLRLLNVYAPELNEHDGPEAHLFTVGWINRASFSIASWTLIVRTYKADPREKYGRWLATIWRKSDGACLNDDIVAAGLATKEKA